MASGLTTMFNRLHGQPESYEKKSKYRFGRTLGAGTYGIVREADAHDGKKVAVKIILKKVVKGNEQMVKDELQMLQSMNHPHIVHFVDWFESKDKFYIVTQLATGGELFDRICDKGRFTEKDASQTIRQVMEAVDYLHARNIVHRDLKPENLLYLGKESNSSLVLADFGIAKMLDAKDEVLTTMAGSFGYAAPEIMLRMGHGKPVDMWSMGVITYTLLCGYSPFRSENMHDLIDECRRGNIIFHERYWKDVSKDAKEFIKLLLQPDPHRRLSSIQALQHRWLTGTTATDHDISKELRSRRIKNRLRLGIERVKLAKRIERLRKQSAIEAETDAEAAHGTEVESDVDEDIPDDADHAADEALSPGGAVKGKLSTAMKADIFRAVVLAKTKEMKQQQEQDTFEASAKGETSKAH